MSTDLGTGPGRENQEKVLKIENKKLIGIEKCPEKGRQWS